MLIEPLEIFYLVILTVVIGFIFMDKVTPIRTIYNIHYRRFNWKNLWFASLVASPGIIIHELGHKFVAMSFGLPAKFYIWPLGLGIGVLLKLINSPLILIAPGYVGIGGNPTNIQMMLISFAGPIVNLILWVSSLLILKFNKKLKRKQMIALFLTAQINMWLFIFNMLPIPPLDGSKVFGGLFHLIFG